MEITQNQGRKDFQIYLVRQLIRENMDVPNAPNPANPNAQDQFVDAVQGPANNNAQLIFSIAEIIFLISQAFAHCCELFSRLKEMLFLQILQEQHFIQS